jgi:hypothetical protein
MIEARAPEMMIPVEESFAAWRKDPKYVAAYTALEDEFSLAAAMIEARALAEIAIKAPSG